MAKILTGKVVASKMKNTVVVEVLRLVPHPLYKKLMRRSKRYKVETKGASLMAGQAVKIVETRSVAKGKHFSLLENNGEKVVEKKVVEKSEKVERPAKRVRKEKKA